MHKEWVSFSNHKTVGKSEAPVSAIQSEVRIHDEESSRRRGKNLEVFLEKKKIIEEFLKGKYFKNRIIVHVQKFNFYSN